MHFKHCTGYGANSFVSSMEGVGIITDQKTQDKYGYTIARIVDVICARFKQLAKYDASHDDDHGDRSLAHCAASLLFPAKIENPFDWPNKELPYGQRCIHAAALLIAEAERVHRTEDEWGSLT